MYALLMDEIVERVLSWAKDKGLNQTKLSEALGGSRQMVTNWKSHGIPAAWHKPIAVYFGKTVDELLGGLQTQEATQDIVNISSGPNIKGKGRYPVISDVQAGHWKEVCEQITLNGHERWGHSHHNLGPCGYMLRVEGPSMTNTESGAKHSFPEGMLLHVNPHLEAIPGRFVIVRRSIENAATFKKLVMIDGDLYLEAINPDWPKRFIKVEPGDEFCGVVVDASFGNLP